MGSARCSRNVATYHAHNIPKTTQPLNNTTIGRALFFMLHSRSHGEFPIPQENLRNKYSSVFHHQQKKSTTNRSDDRQPIQKWSLLSLREKRERKNPQK